MAAQTQRAPAGRQSVSVAVRADQHATLSVPQLLYWPRFIQQAQVDGELQRFLSSREKGNALTAESPLAPETKRAINAALNLYFSSRGAQWLERGAEPDVLDLDSVAKVKQFEQELKKQVEFLDHMQGGHHNPRDVVVDGKLDPLTFFALDQLAWAIERDEQAARRFLDPARTRRVASVVPLIGGKRAFEEMASAIAKAKERVLLAGWSFDPTLEVAGSPSNWGQLLAAAAARADVRVLLSDMDPIGNPDRHRLAWAAFRALTPGPARLQTIVSLHDASIDASSVVGGVALGAAVWALPGGVLILPLVKSGYDSADREVRHALMDRFRDLTAGYRGSLVNMPGVWKNLRRVEGELQLAPEKELDVRFHVASHHQKFCVVDGKVAFCGGIDVVRGRADRGWRDVHCQVSGEIVSDFERAFIARWNGAIAGFSAYVAKANEIGQTLGPGYRLPVKRPTPLPEPAPPATAAAGDGGELFGEIDRTESVNAHATLMSTTCAGIHDSYERVIAAAEKFIYLENQYLRAPWVAEKIVARLSAAPDLQVIIVLPSSVEEKDRLLTPHGNYLQTEAIAALLRAFRDRPGQFGIYVPRGGPYIHSKVLIVDDAYASIGSANANGRSFELDTELNLGWVGSTSVSAFRVDAWHTLLGIAKTQIRAWRPSEYAQRWFAVSQERTAPIKVWAPDRRNPSRQCPYVPASIVDPLV